MRVEEPAVLWCGSLSPHPNSRSFFRETVRGEGRVLRVQLSSELCHLTFVRVWTSSLKQSRFMAFASVGQQVLAISGAELKAVEGPR